MFLPTEEILLFFVDSNLASALSTCAVVTIRYLAAVSHFDWFWCTGIRVGAENFVPPLFYSRPLRTVLSFAGPEVDLRYCSSAWSEDSEYMLFMFGDPLERKFVLKCRPVVVVVGGLLA